MVKSCTYTIMVKSIAEKKKSDEISHTFYKVYIGT